MDVEEIVSYIIMTIISYINSEIEFWDLGNNGNNLPFTAIVTDERKQFKQITEFTGEDR